MIGDIAEPDIISVNAETDQEEAARLMERLQSDSACRWWTKVAG